MNHDGTQREDRMRFAFTSPGILSIGAFALLACAGDPSGPEGRFSVAVARVLPSALTA